jgi:hypothetical protein
MDMQIGVLVHGKDIMTSGRIKEEEEKNWKRDGVNQESKLCWFVEAARDSGTRFDAKFRFWCSHALSSCIFLRLLIGLC